MLTYAYQQRGREGPEWVYSGGQTGVDTGALLAAQAVGAKWGGWAPLGWLREDGVVPDALRFPQEGGCGLREHGTQDKFSKLWDNSAKYVQRTKTNIIETDFTLVLTNSIVVPEGGIGTGLTITTCVALAKPYRVVDMSNRDQWFMEIDGLVQELIERGVQKINVAGHRGSHYELGELHAQVYVEHLLSQFPRYK